jgi:GNAT superfamily N-acetyltransferase
MSPEKEVKTSIALPESLYWRLQEVMAARRLRMDKEVIAEAIKMWIEAPPGIWTMAQGESIPVANGTTITVPSHIAPVVQQFIRLLLDPDPRERGIGKFITEHLMERAEEDAQKAGKPRKPSSQESPPKRARNESSRR